MGKRKTELDVDFIGDSNRRYTEEEERAVSEFIRKLNEKNSKSKSPSKSKSRKRKQAV